MEDPPPDPEPPAAAVLGRCGRHPAQPLAGVCSSCLAERLSSVRSPAHPEIVEVATTARHPDAHHQQGKLRNTLGLLFQMDDDDSGAARQPDTGEDPQPSFKAGLGHRGGANRGPKSKAGSWLRSIFPKKGPHRRTPGKDEPPRPPDPPGGGEDATPQVERRASLRRSCEWMVCRDPPPAGSSSRGDPPRHSWDGSMVGRALACSFACLDEPSGGVTTRVRHSNAEESSVGENTAESRNAEESSVAAGCWADDVGDDGRRSCGDTGPEMTVSGSVGRRRSNRWSRVWDRSITSPLKELVRKGEHALDRSLSESTRRCANRQTATDVVDGEARSGRSGLSVPGRASQGAARSSQAGWLKNKECRIGRSRSVHYTAPGTYDNGMLRFYLTPMRSTRAAAASRGRRRSSRFFSRGLFGFV